MKVEEKPVVKVTSLKKDEHLSEKYNARTKIYAFLICLVLAGAYIYTLSPSKDSITIETYCSHNSTLELYGCGFRGHVNLDNAESETIYISGWWKVKTVVDSNTVDVSITCNEDCEGEEGNYVVMTVKIYYNGEEVVSDRRDCTGSSREGCTNTASYTKPVDEN